MMAKIEWYQEILALEPGSKVFFPFAKCLVQEGQFAEAVDVLQKGLAQHPEYLEARIFLVQLLHEQGNLEQCLAESDRLAALFSAYPGFWDAWSTANEGKNPDVSLVLSYLATAFRYQGISLNQIFAFGLQAMRSSKTLITRTGTSVAGDAPDIHETAHAVEAVQPTSQRLPKDPCERLTVLLAAPPVVDMPQVVGDVTNHAPHNNASGTNAFATNASDDDESEDNVTLSTRSMAEVLAEQGDVAGALAIYKELEALADTPEERIELRQRSATLSGAAAGIAAENDIETGTQVQTGFKTETEITTEAMGDGEETSVVFSVAQEVAPHVLESESSAHASSSQVSVALSNVTSNAVSTNTVSTNTVSTNAASTNAASTNAASTNAASTSASRTALKGVLENLAERLEARARA